MELGLNGNMATIYSVLASDITTVEGHTSTLIVTEKEWDLESGGTLLLLERKGVCGKFIKYGAS